MLILLILNTKMKYNSVSCMRHITIFSVLSCLFVLNKIFNLVGYFPLTLFRYLKYNSFTSWGTKFSPSFMSQTNQQWLSTQLSQ